MNESCPLCHRHTTHSILHYWASAPVQRFRSKSPRTDRNLCPLCRTSPWDRGPESSQQCEPTALLLLFVVIKVWQDCTNWSLGGSVIWVISPQIYFTDSGTALTRLLLWNKNTRRGVHPGRKFSSLTTAVMMSCGPDKLWVLCWTRCSSSTLVAWGLTGAAGCQRLVQTLFGFCVLFLWPTRTQQMSVRMGAGSRREAAATVGAKRRQLETDGASRSGRDRRPQTVCCWRWGKTPPPLFFSF